MPDWLEGPLKEWDAHQAEQDRLWKKIRGEK